jgi:hypothetical protein
MSELKVIIGGVEYVPAPKPEPVRELLDGIEKETE